jgi:hypothetical protein
VLAFNATTPHVDLAPVLGNVARADRLSCYLQQDLHITRRDAGKFPSRWVVMARRRADLGRVARDRRWQACPRDAHARTWTDDYSNVTAALHLG